MKFITAVALYFLFAATSMVAWIAGLAALCVGQLQYTANIMHSMDMLLAAMLGWDGRATVSKECGLELQQAEPCRFCRWVCRVLDVILEKNHCQKEAS